MWRDCGPVLLGHLFNDLLALPNGPKVSAGGALSPRGDWRAPSDSVADTWLAELAAALPPLED